MPVFISEKLKAVIIAPDKAEAIQLLTEMAELCSNQPKLWIPDVIQMPETNNVYLFDATHK
jgi:hypothetical protein